MNRNRLFLDIALNKFANLFSSWIVRHKRIFRYIVVIYCYFHKFRLRQVGENYSLQLHTRSIIFSADQLYHCKDLINSFVFYFDSINLDSHEVKHVIDLSKPNFHSIKNWGYFDVHFPTFIESIETSQQYIDLLQLSEGETVIDLGAYAGLSSMHFKNQVGLKGNVIAVEVDAISLQSTSINFKNYQQLFGDCPKLIQCAAWSSDTEIDFLPEGNVGSSVLGINSRNQFYSRVPARTLSSITRMSNSLKIDAVKADIEGSEYEAFKDHNFFHHHKPRVVFEAILFGRKSPLYLKACDLLKNYGYSLQVFQQSGSDQSLVLATPIMMK